MTPSELKAWRESMGMTQRDLGDFLKPRRTEHMVSRWELGKSPIPEWLDAVKQVAEQNRHASRD